MSVEAWDTLNTHPKVIEQLKAMVTQEAPADADAVNVVIHDGVVTVSMKCEAQVTEISMRYAPVATRDRKPKTAQWKRDRGLGRFAR